MPRDTPTLDGRTAAAPKREAAMAHLRHAVTGLVPAMRRNAPDLDRRAAFPAADVAALHALGVLLAPLPLRRGGLGLGTETQGAAGLFDLLRLLGLGNPAVGRIVEGHVNALALICAYGTPAQIAGAAADAADGHLFAIWNTEAQHPVRLADGRTLPDLALIGRKDHVSAAGCATRPLITVNIGDESRMLLAALHPNERAQHGGVALQGMRATQPGSVDFAGYVPSADAWIGAPGDYLRDPAFSAGAWRTLAVIVGAIEGLVGELRAQLRARGRDANPHQASRIAQALIAQETAALWTHKAACIAEARAAETDAITGYVNLARRAVEMAALDAIDLAQRSLGLAALMDGNPAERMIRDLATYLRQPALDEALQEAVAHFVVAPLPEPA